MSYIQLYFQEVRARVSKVTEKGNNLYITVEDPINKLAFRVKSQLSNIDIGDWIIFDGMADTEYKGRPGNVEVREYYHLPHDGTNKNEWYFHEIRETTSFMKLVTPKISNKAS